MNRLLFFIISLLMFSNSALADSVISKDHCNDNIERNIICTGWYPWEPYQYKKSMNISLNELIALKVS